MFRPVSAVRSSTRSFATANVRRLIICGAPASGKGTQCEKIVEEFKIPHLSTGDLLRAAVKAGSPLGKEARAYMDAGKLVPDSLVINLVKETLATPEFVNGGWLLDGCPRTAEQAKALQNANFHPDKVILLDVPDSALIERVTGRRSDPVTGTIPSKHCSSNCCYFRCSAPTIHLFTLTPCRVCRPVRLDLPREV